METCSAVLRFGYVFLILLCDRHLNEIALAVLLHGTICCSLFFLCILVSKRVKETLVLRG